MPSLILIRYIGLINEDLKSANLVKKADDNIYKKKK